MPAEVVQLFPDNGENPNWYDEVLGFVARKLDEMTRQDGMEKIEDFTGAVFNVKSVIMGQLALSLIKKKHADLLDQEYCPCPKCRRTVKAWNKKVKRRVESLAGSFDLFRPYFYCKRCGFGFYPLDEALGLAAGPKQHDIQELEAWLSSELPFDTAAEAFRRCTGDDLSADHMHVVANRIGGESELLDICPGREEVHETIAELSVGKYRRPVMMLGVDGAHAPTRPEPSPWKGKRGKGEYKEVKGFRLYLLDSDRIIHLISWHQIQTDRELAESLRAIKEAGLIPEDKVRLCTIGDGAPWIWNRIREIFPTSKEVLDYYHCSEHVHLVGNTQYGKGTRQAQQWVDATLTRLFKNRVGDVIRGLKVMDARSEAAREKVNGLIRYLTDHAERVKYGAAKRGGYQIGSGAIESANKFISHVRMKRSGAWWYITYANNILKLRCAKYNGTFERVMEKYKALDRRKTYGAGTPREDE